MAKATDERRKEKWHYARAGTGMPASLSHGIKYGYEAELKERGVHDAEGKTTPLRNDPERKEKAHPGHTWLLNVGKDDPSIKTGMGPKSFAFRD